jgi:hypothetical protein
MLSHLVEYTSWFNEYEPAEWVMGQAAGRGKLSDTHASPDYIAGVVHFRNGIRGVYDCGAGAPDVPEVPYWWRKCRIGALGSEGYAEVHTGTDGERSRETGSSRVRAEWTTTMHGSIRPRDGGLADGNNRPHPLRFARVSRAGDRRDPYRSVIEGGRSRCRSPPAWTSWQD